MDSNAIFNPDSSVHRIEAICIANLKAKYPSVFSDSMGKIIGLQARIKVRADAICEFIKVRSVWCPLLDAVEKQLDEQVAEWLLEKVDNSEWSTPLVVPLKSSNE